MVIECRKAKDESTEVKVTVGDRSLTFADKALRIGGRDAFVIDGPGEYEVNGTFVRAVATEGAEGKLNTSYSVLFDDIRLVHLGAASSIAAESKGALVDSDILFSPDPKFVSALEPKIVVPLYDVKGKDAPKPIDKLVIKRKDIEGKEGEIITICSQ